MRKNITLLLLCMLCSSNVWAHGVFTGKLLPDSRYTVLQFGCWPVSLFDSFTPVYGLNVNLLLSVQSTVNGLTVAPLVLSDDHLRGVTIGLFTGASWHSGLLLSLFSRLDSNNGVQIGLVNRVEMTDEWGESNHGGLQIGIFSYSDANGFQIGLLNYNKQSRIKWLPLVNFHFDM